MIKKIQIFDHLIHYFEYHALKPKGTIIFLHGFSSDMQIHLPVQAKLLDYDYYSLDFPGHGLNVAKSIADFSIHVYARIVVEFIKLKKLTKIILIGHSMGGAVSALVCNQINLDLIAKVVMIGPVNKTIQAIGPQLYPVFFPKSFDDFVIASKNFEYDFHRGLSNPKTVKETKKWIELINGDSLYAIGFKTLGPSLMLTENVEIIEMGIKKIKCPFLLIYGEFDKVINTAAIWPYYQSLLPQAQKVCLKDNGHIPWSIDFDAYLVALTNFLDQ
ncbi:Alpha/beta hydrolase [[Mycoplasma] cavipharyngis]|uniref:alpha/beta fold hydrolase n=1 Tax=[Mycoplasma] cavipharyngis TaxID=92757 RepID=UPI003704D251